MFRIEVVNFEGCPDSRDMPISVQFDTINVVGPVIKFLPMLSCPEYYCEIS